MAQGRRGFVKLLTVAALLGSALSAPAFAQTAVKVTLDWKYQGPTSFFLIALDKGISSFEDVYEVRYRPEKPLFLPAETTEKA